MGECWDYRIKKVDIAWQIALKLLEQKENRQRHREDPTLKVEDIKGCLIDGWDMVNEVLPGHTDPTKK